MRSSPILSAWFRIGGSGAVVLVLLGALAPSASAQNRTRPGPGLLDVQITRAQAGNGLSAADARAINVLLEQTLAIVQRTAAAAAPPENVCAQLDARTTAPAEAAIGGVTLSLSFPLLISGRCQNVTVSGVAVFVNDARPLLDNPLPGPGVHALTDEGGAMYAPPRRERSPAPFPRFGDFVVITRLDIPIFVPLTKERYLRALERTWEAALQEVQGDAAEIAASGSSYERWLREERPRMVAEFEKQLEELAAHLSKAELETMRRNLEQVLAQMDETARQQPQLAAEFSAGLEGVARETRASLEAVRRELAQLLPAERKLPTCLVLDEVYTTAGPASCPPELQPVVLNPQYFDRSLPRDRAQLMLVGTRAGTHVTENREHLELRTRVFETLDYATLAALLR